MVNDESKQNQAVWLLVVLFLLLLIAKVIIMTDSITHKLHGY